MTEISLLLPAILRQIQVHGEFTESLVLALWRCIVGETLAQHTQPTRLHRSTLVISVPSETWRKELFALRFEILKRLEQFLGKERITAVEFRVDPRLEASLRVSEKEVATDVPEPAPLASAKLPDLELSRSVAAAAANYFNRR
jgi:hypothetical protein